MPMLNVQMPASAESTYSTVLQIATFRFPFVDDVTDWVKEQIKELIMTEDENIEISDGTRKLVEVSRSTADAGYMTSNPFVNSAFAIMLSSVIAIVFLTVLLLKCAIQKNKSVNKLYTLIKQKMFWGVVIRYILENFIMLSVAYMIKLYALSFETITQALTSVFTVGVVILLIAIPLVTTHFLFVSLDSEEIFTEKFTQRYGMWVLYVDTKRRLALLFNVVFMARRLVIAFLIVVLPNMNWLQRQLIVFTCVITMLYTGIARPFIGIFHNNLEVVNELLILWNSYFMLLFSDFILNVNTRYMVGWANTGVIVALVVVNIILLSCV